MMSRQLVRQRELFEWLHSLDLSHYFEPFLQSGYEELRICAEMGETDLEIIGVRDIHEKIELLQAIRHLRFSHFEKESFSASASGQMTSEGCRPIPTNYLETQHTQINFQNEGNDDVQYCLQKRYLPTTGCGNNIQVEDSSCNTDYQDIDDCDCAPFSRETFYEALSPRRRYSDRHQPLSQHDLVCQNEGTRTKQVTAGRKFNNQCHSLFEELSNAIPLTRTTQLRDHHPIRQKRHPLPSEPSRPFGTGGHFNESTQGSIGGGRQRGGSSSHLYGTPLLPSSSLRKVESEDLDSSSGIEPDLVSRKCYDPRNPNSTATFTTTSLSTNTASSSSTPDETHEQIWWDSSQEKTKSGGGESWYRGPPVFGSGSLAKREGNSKKSSRNRVNYGGLDVLQLQTCGQHSQKSSSWKRSGTASNYQSSPKSNSTLSRRQRGVGLTSEVLSNCYSVVPTVSGLLSSIESKQFNLQPNPPQGVGGPTKNGGLNMASNLNCREYDYEECTTNNTYEEINRLTPNNYRTPSHHPYPNHQYLEHVIICNGSPSSKVGHPQSTMHPPMGYGNESQLMVSVGSISSPCKSRQIYTPGIYLPSSCLTDRDDIYDYAPPIQRNRLYQSSPAKTCSSSPFRSKGKSKSKLSLSCVSGLGCENSGRGSPVGQEDIVSRGSEPMTPLHRSASLLTSHSTPTYVNVGSSGLGRCAKGRKATATGGGNGPKVLSFPSSPSSQSSNGCRTLANLSKLSRRLGLGRLFRTLRIQGLRVEGSARRNTVLTKPRPLPSGTGNQLSTTQQRSQDEYSVPRSSNDIQDYSATTIMSSLPSNERIIETINRLKYEELQKRKERIAQEHETEPSEGPTLQMSQTSSSTLSPGRNSGGSPRSPARFTNPMKGRKKNRNQTEGDCGVGLEEDSIEADGFLPLPPLSAAGSTGSGTSPGKSLLSKVKELGSKNHKKLRRFSFSSKLSQSDHTGSGGGGLRRGSDVVVSPTKRTSAAIDIVGGFKMVERNSSEEELSSLPSIHQRSLSICDIEEYNGPFVGKAVALVDCISSPYDLHALSYKKGEVLEIIEKKPTGSWKGKVNNKVGYFKFINVQVLPEDKEEAEGECDTTVPYPTSSLDSSTFPYSTSNGSTQGRRRMKATSPLTPWEMETRQVVANVINGIRKENAALLQLNIRREQGDHSGPGEELHPSTDTTSQQYQIHSGAYQKRGKSSGRRRSSSTSLKKERPRSVGDLLRRINLEEHIPLFILHGFESLDLFKEIEEEDLDRLAILGVADRAKIMTAVELLRDYDATEEIPPIIIPTYSCPNSIEGQDEDEDTLNQILEPPPNFTRGGSAGTAAVRDSGVFLKCDDKEEEDPEVEEIILSPSNLPINSLNPSDKFLMSNLRHKNTKANSSHQGKPAAVQELENVLCHDSSMAQFSSLEEHYGEVRQRFLHAKSLFESSANNVGTGVLPASSSNVKPLSSEYKNQFHYCEKSSDSGISVGANSPPPNNNNTFE